MFKRIFTKKLYTKPIIAALASDDFTTQDMLFNDHLYTTGNACHETGV
jgi:hypothetical protein